ncbi:MAG: tandem-95 repeat protein, partial [Hydrogenophaga sp.]|nr:tandem-95 repeat protein [Hydrogenophaga sp.]
GTLEQQADGTYVYRPAANYHGLDAISFTVSDGTVDVPATLALVIESVNDAPVIEPRTLTLLEDGEQVIDFLAGVSDVDGDALTVSIVNGPQHGTLEQQADGTYVYRPAADYHGNDAISFSVSDGTVAVPATLAMVVESVNDAPVVPARTLTLLEDGEQVIDFLAGVSDVDGDALMVTIVSGPQHGTLEQQADGTYVYRPSADYHGLDAISFSVSDGTVEVPATLALVVESVNDAPVVPARTLTLLEDGEQVIDFLAGVSDVDGDTLTVTIVNGPQHGTLNQQADGTFVYRPSADYHGLDAISFTVGDGTVDVPATLALVVESVNDAPTIAPRTLTLLEDGELAIDFLTGVIDVDGDTLTVTITSGPQHGTLNQQADGTFVYRPSADYHGNDAISFSVSDGTVEVPATLALVIESVNDAPVAVDDLVVTDEDNTIRLYPMANDHDVDGDMLQLRLLSQPAHGTLVRHADNSFSYTPVAHWSGEDSFSYVLNDGWLDSATATVRIVVNPVADAPTLVLTDLSADTRELFRTGWESVSNRNTTSTLLQRKELEGWTLITTPDTRSGGSNGFEIWSTGDRMQNAQHAQVTVQAMNDNGRNWLELNNAGNAMAQTLGIERQVQTTAGATYTLSMDLAGRLGFGADYTRIGIYVDGVRIGGDESTSGATSLNWATRSFSFTGNGQQQKIRIATEATRFDANGRGMMIDDIALSERLAANTGLEDTAIRLSAISAVLQDTDGSETLSVHLLGLPLGAVLTDGTRIHTVANAATPADISGWAMGQLVLTPPQDYHGTLALQVRATATESANGHQASTTATIHVNVLPVNDVIDLQDQQFVLDEDQSVVLTPALVDADGDTLSLRLVKAPANGVLRATEDGRWVYTPKANWSGEDSFSYVLNDGQVDSRVATVRLSINPVADAPTLVLTDQHMPARELFRTGWETVRDVDHQSTLVQQQQQQQLEGWTLVTTGDNYAGGSNGFEVWSSNDRMQNAQGSDVKVKAMAGNGHNWLELNNASLPIAQTLGIERSMQTVAGASYTLSMDLAGRMGFGADFTRIGIYVDGVRIGGDQSTSGATALNWATRSFSFTGNGQAQTIRIVSEATQFHEAGRGMMIDDIVLTERLPANTGLEDTAIRLSAISAALKDTDGSEILQLRLAGLPAGTRLSDGWRSFTATATQSVANITGWNLAQLSLTPPKDFTGTLALQVQAIATEKANGSTVAAVMDLSVTVLPVNDAPLASNLTVQLPRNGAAVIDFAKLVSDVDGDALSLSLGQPKQGSLLRNANGSYTYTPRSGFYGTDSFTYSVSDGQQTVSATVTLRVLSSTSASTVLTAAVPQALSSPLSVMQGNTWLVINQGKPRTPPPPVKIDWVQTVPDMGAPVPNGWLVQHSLGKATTEPSLAELTGLVFKLPG